MKRTIETLEFVVSQESSGKRLDQYLCEAYPDFSRTYIKRLIEDGYVYINTDKIKKASKKLRTGERIIMHIPEPEPIDIKPERIPLEIIYEDEDLVVINKPCGMVVHPSPGYTSGTLVNALLYHFKSLSSIGGKDRPGIVHRLDKDTAGLIVVAKNNVAHTKLSQQFSQRKTEKLYRVLVKGTVKADYDLITLPIGRNRFNRKTFSVFSDTGKSAITEYWTIRRFTRSNVSLLKVRIHTGRTHQIRVHLSFIGYPVLGDKVYGFKKEGVPEIILESLKNCNMLIAYRLSFHHPSTNTWMSFRIEDPEPFRSVLKTLQELDNGL